MKPITVYSIHTNRPDFVITQNDSLKYFLMPNFELVVVNNAREESHREKINRAAQYAGLPCIQFSSDTPFSLAGKHHADALNYVWQNYAVYDRGYVMILDGDMFLVANFDVTELMREAVIAGPPQHRKKIYQYLSPTIVLFDMSVMPDAKSLDWEGRFEDGVAHLDTGGGFYRYFKSHPEVKTKTKLMTQTHHINSTNGTTFVLPKSMRSSYEDEWGVELYNHNFLHYRSSSGWEPRSSEYHTKKSLWVHSFVYGAINSSFVIEPHDYTMTNEVLGWPNA